MRFRRCLAVLALLVAPLAACGDDDDAAVTDDGADITDPVTDDEDDADEDEIPSHTITATDYEFDVPEELTGGVVELTLENEGDEVHEAFMVTLPEDMEVEELIEEMGGIIEGGPIPDYFEVATGIAEVEPGESVTSTISLPEGRYGLICTIQEGTTSLDDEEGEESEEGQAPTPEGVTRPEGDQVEGTTETAAEDGTQPEDAGEPEGEEEQPPMHAELGMHAVVEVTDANDLELPELDGQVTITDYDFEFPELEGGDHELMAVNEGEEFHHVVLLEWPEEVESEEQAEEMLQMLLEAGEGPPPEGAVEPDFLGGTTVFSPGAGGSFEVSLEEDRFFTALCFIHDREGGPPHVFAHEMYRTFQT
jgi:hypothetical protein